MSNNGQRRNDSQREGIGKSGSNRDRGVQGLEFGRCAPASRRHGASIVNLQPFHRLILNTAPPGRRKLSISLALHGRGSLLRADQRVLQQSRDHAIRAEDDASQMWGEICSMYLDSHTLAVFDSR